MIELVHHSDIDPRAWDRRVEASANPSWYGLSATLSAAAPGWDALVDRESGACMPLPWRSKHGVRYAYQPFLIQHLGPYRPGPEAPDAAAFLRALPTRFRYADICVQASAPLPARPCERCEARVNHVLRLDGPLERLRAGYSQNHRRSLRKAGELGVAVERGAGAGAVTGWLEASEQFLRWGISGSQREAMRRVIAATETDGSGFGRMVRAEGSPVAAGWFVRHGGRIYFLKGLGSARGRDLRAMHALMDDVVAEHAGSGMVLDFAGGNDPSLARFYGGFGAEREVYFRALLNRLPPLIRLMKP